MLIAGAQLRQQRRALSYDSCLAGFALVSMHQCHRNLLRASFVAASAPPIFAGTKGVLYVTLGNEARFARYGIEVRVLDGARGNLDIPVNGQAQASVPLPESKRGVLRIDRLHITTSYPYNLFQAWTWVHLPLEALVYPRPHGSASMPTESATSPALEPWRLAGADEWRSLRPFRDGDSPRQVAWTAYARGSPLLVKEYSALGAELRCSTSASCANSTPKLALEQLARWIVDADSRGERYGLVLPNRLLPARRAARNTATNASRPTRARCALPGKNDAR